MEQALIEKAKNGDVAAFEQLIAQHQTLVYNLCLKTLGNREDAAEVAQEALLKVYQNIRSFHGDSKFSTWVYRVTYHVCIDEIRKRKRHRHISIDELYDQGTDAKIIPVDPSPTPQDAVQTRELHEMIEKAIATLPPNQRMAILLRDMSGLSYEEIAIAQSCSLGTIKSRINRGRRQLQKILAPYMEQTGCESRQTPWKGGLQDDVQLPRY